MSNPIAVSTPRTAAPTAGPLNRRRVAPAVDVYENADEIVLVADVPGAASDAFNVSLENDTLTLETQRSKDQDVRALAREYEEVDYSRVFRIPAGIDVGQVAAEAKNGTLVVRLPKSAAAKPRKVLVKAS